MPQMHSLDPAHSIQQQLGIDTGPVVLANLFLLETADEVEFLARWQEDAAFMKQQPGFISTQLHRATGERATFLNYAVWESTAHFRAAFGHPEFKEKVAAYPESVVVAPHLFEKVAVPGVCVA